MGVINEQVTPPRLFRGVRDFKKWGRPAGKDCAVETAPEPPSLPSHPPKAQSLTNNATKNPWKTFPNRKRRLLPGPASSWGNGLELAAPRGDRGEWGGARARGAGAEYLEWTGTGGEFRASRGLSRTASGGGGSPALGPGLPGEQQPPIRAYKETFRAAAAPDFSPPLHPTPARPPAPPRPGRPERRRGGGINKPLSYRDPGPVRPPARRSGPGAAAHSAARVPAARPSAPRESLGPAQDAARPAVRPPALPPRGPGGTQGRGRPVARGQGAAAAGPEA